MGGGAVGIGGLVISAWLAAGGHGSYLPAIVLFPYAMAIAIALDRIALPLVFLALAQYIVYAVILGVGRGRGRRGAFWFTIVGLHVVAALATAVIARTDGRFWP